MSIGTILCLAVVGARVSIAEWKPPPPPVGHGTEELRRGSGLQTPVREDALDRRPPSIFAVMIFSSPPQIGGCFENQRAEVPLV